MATMTIQDGIEILTLAADVEPIAVTLVKNLLTDIQGKTTEEIVADSDNIFDRVIAKAKSELAAAQPPTPTA